MDEITKGVVLVGIPASGKSTYAEMLKERGYKIISTDAIREELGCLNDMSRNEEVFNIFHKRIFIESIKNDIVVDATNLTVDSRRQILRAMNSDMKEIVYFDVEVAEAIKRNNERTKKVPDEVICKLHDRLEPPQICEGVSSIITIKIGGI